VNDVDQVRRFDPDGANPFNFYDVNFNDVTGELYLRDGATVYSYAVPEPGIGLLLAAGGAGLGFRRRAKWGAP
jgi:hypothetical protein